MNKTREELLEETVKYAAMLFEKPFPYYNLETHRNQMRFTHGAYLIDKMLVNLEKLGVDV